MSKEGPTKTPFTKTAFVYFSYCCHYSLFHSFSLSLLLSFTPSLFHSFSLSLLLSFTLSLSFTPSLFHSFSLSLLLSFTPSLFHSFSLSLLLSFYLFVSFAQTPFHANRPNYKNFAFLLFIYSFFLSFTLKLLHDEISWFNPLLKVACHRHFRCLLLFFIGFLLHKIPFN